MPSPTPTPELLHAMEADWQEQLSNSGESIWDDQSNGILDALKIIDRPETNIFKNKTAWCILLSFLVSFPRGAEKGKNLGAEHLDSEGGDPRKLLDFGEIRDFWVSKTKEITEAGQDRNAAHEVHEKHFYVAKFIILTVKMIPLSCKVAHRTHSIPGGKETELKTRPINHTFFVTHERMARDWILYADYLCASGIFAERSKELLQDHLPLATLVKMLNTELDLIRTGRSKELSINRAKEHVSKLNESHDQCAWSQLTMLTVSDADFSKMSRSNYCTGTGRCYEPACENSRKKLIELCSQVERKLMGIRTFEDLHSKEAEYKDVLKAVLWGSYFCEIVVLKEANEVKRALTDKAEEGHKKATEPTDVKPKEDAKSSKASRVKAALNQLSKSTRTVATAETTVVDAKPVDYVLTMDNDKGPTMEERKATREMLRSLMEQCQVVATKPLEVAVLLAEQ